MFCSLMSSYLVWLLCCVRVFSFLGGLRVPTPLVSCVGGSSSGGSPARAITNRMRTTILKHRTFLDAQADDYRWMLGCPLLACFSQSVCPRLSGRVLVRCRSWVLKLVVGPCRRPCPSLWHGLWLEGTTQFSWRFVGSGWFTWWLVW